MCIGLHAACLHGHAACKPQPYAQRAHRVTSLPGSHVQEVSR
jgi:hypothetical protein